MNYKKNMLILFRQNPWVSQLSLDGSRPLARNPLADYAGEGIAGRVWCLLGSFRGDVVSKCLDIFR